VSRVLDGKVALVTGARTGIGAATAIALAKAGATVFACGRKPGDCQPVVEQITAAGGKAVDRPLDVADLATIAAKVEAIVKEAGRLDIIVNNAGTIEPMAPIGGIDPLAFDLAMRTNVSGPAALINAAWPHLKGHGRIVNLLSGAAARPMLGWAAYCASKAALLMLTRSVGLEGKPSGIACFGLAPGLVDTAMQGAIREARINDISNIPREKLASPGHAANAIVWLASGAADHLAGTMADIRDEEFAKGLQAFLAATG